MQKKRIISVVAILIVSGMGRADFTFGPPMNLGPVVNGPAADCCPNLAADGLTLYFSSGRPGGFGDYDIWFCTRPNLDAPWGPPVNIGHPINSQYYDAYPCVSGDGLRLYFSEHWQWNPKVGARIPAGSTDLWNTEIWMSARASPGAPWGPVVSAGTPPNSTGSEISAAVACDDLTLIFAAMRAGGQGYTDLLMCSRATPQELWGPALNCGAAVNSYSMESGPCLSPDGLAMFFESCRDNPPFVWDIWMTTRKSRSAAWGPAVKRAATVNTADNEWNPALSPDGRTLYFTSNRAGGRGNDDLYEAPILPIVDLNADGMLDDKDMLAMQETWNRADPRGDIGPMPWGDGVVDTYDLIVLGQQLLGKEPIAPVPHAQEVAPDVVLSWMAVPFARAYDVYLGTSLADVTGADRTNPRNVLVSKAQATTSYDPEGLLEYGRTCYWRVDFVNPGSDPTIYRGSVLDFTTRAFAYALKNVVATASSAQAGMGPEKTVDGSGLDKSDGHTTEAKAMWLSSGPSPNWIQYQFDRICRLHELWVWNSNQVVEPFMGFGARIVTIEYSTDGTSWTLLKDVPEFARASGQPGYAANAKVSFGGVSARYVKLTITKNWGAAPQTGLSEVRFFYIADASPVQP
ncbi:MAG: discoidin domain-containing protein [Planctomycetes bacterium]|jgi:hypothetical protein|nr:discoidin domain-containing protein [Planctomycetota bacterium]